MSRHHCQACTNAKFGVKTRKSVPHTCGRDEQGRAKLKPTKVLDFPKIFNQKMPEETTPHPGPWHAVEYCGTWNIQDQPDYLGKNLLDADDVGENTAAHHAKLAARAPSLLSELEHLRKENEVLKQQAGFSEEIQHLKEQLAEVREDLELVNKWRKMDRLDGITLQEENTKYRQALESIRDYSYSNEDITMAHYCRMIAKQTLNQ